MCTPFLREELFAVLPPRHPLAKRGELSFADLNGETFLLRQRLGFGEPVVERMLDRSVFISQPDDKAFDAVRSKSELLSFTSDIMIAREELPADRNSIRITDEEARVTYYACMLPNLSPKQRPLYEKLRERRLI